VMVESPKGYNQKFDYDPEAQRFRLAEKAILNLEMLDRFFDDSNIAGQRYLVGMLFPEKLTYSEGGCRTTKMNEAASVIYVKNKELQEKKWGKNLF